MIPFLSSAAGDSQVKVKLLGRISAAEKFLGGPLGTTVG